MTLSQQIITIGICAVGTMATRFLPFLLFRDSRPAPPLVRYLGQTLPAAIFAMLVVYCLKDVPLRDSPHGLPEALAILATVLLHLWRRHFLLSIAAGTAFYMFVVQVLCTAGT